MSESNGNGHSGLAALLNPVNQDDVEVKINNPDGTYSGVSFFFKPGPMDARTDTGYSHILQKSTRQRHSTLDEANRYVFKHRYTRSIGIDEASLKAAGFGDAEIAQWKANEARFLETSERFWPILRPAIVQYISEVTPDAETSKS